MKIALLGDVHANLPALEAVLEHAASHQVEAIWNIGDFVGYGAYPNEVVVRLRQVGAISIAGNYDLKVLRYPEKEEKWQKRKHPLKLQAFRWAYHQLTSQNRQYLASLPEERRLTVEGYRVLLTHASPASYDEPLYANTPEERLRQLAGLAQAEMIVFGHSHQPFIRRIPEAWFINTGSVGRPDDGDPRACYALAEISTNHIEVEHFRLPYNVERAAAAIRDQKLPEAFAQMALQGRDLITVLGGRNADESLRS